MSTRINSTTHSPLESPETFKEYIDREIASADRRYEDRYILTQKALDAALAANNIKLKDMNEFRNAMADAASRYIHRSEVESALRATDERVDQIVGPMQEKLSSQGKTNWPLLTGFGTILAAVLGGCWLLIGLQIAVAMTPLALATEQFKVGQANTATALTEVAARLRLVEQDTAKSQLSDAESRTDRIRLNDRVRDVENGAGIERTERSAADTDIRATMSEIETQFKSVGNMIAVANDRSNQWIELLWNKTFPNSPFPRQGYVSVVARHDPLRAK